METTETPQVVEKTEEELLKEKLAEIALKKEKEGVDIMNEAMKQIEKLGLEVVPKYHIEGTQIIQSAIIIRAKK